MKNPLSGVEVVRSSHSHMQGKMSSRSFGLPFLYNRQRVSSQMTSDSHIYQGFSNSNIQSYMSMFRDATQSDGKYSHRLNSGVLFMAMTSHEVKQNAKKRFGGVFKWFFHKEKTTKGYFKWQLNRLIHKLGLDKARQINLNDFEGGFVSAELDLALTHLDIEKLIKFNEKIDSLQVTDKLNSYFGDAENIKIHCGTRTVKFCMSLLYKNTYNAIKAIPHQLEAMRKAYKQNNFKLFNKELGKLGKLALTNRFVLSEIFQIAGKEKMTGVLKIQGSHLPQVQIQF